MNKPVLAENGLLVTGARGRIGQLLRALWDGREVTWSGRKSDFAWDMGGAAPELPDGVTVLHLAGSTGGDLGQNLRAARGLARALRPGHRVVLVSSIAVYGPGGPFAETDLPQPNGDYARAKLEVEAILGPFNPLILRLGNLFGADALTRQAFAGPVVLDRAGPAGPRRSWIGPQTFARVLWELLDAPPGVVNLAQPPALAMGDLLEALGADYSFGPREAPTPLAEMQLDRLARLVDLAPATPEGLARELLDLKGIWP